MKIVFAKTRYKYDSYVDFWRLVELSKFDTCFFDEIDFNAGDTIYITSPINGEQPPHIKNNLGRGQRKARIVWWCLERPDDGNRRFADVVNEEGTIFDAVWSSDKLVASMHPDVQFVVLGSHAGLRTQVRLPDAFDFTHQSYAWGRRLAIYTELCFRGFRQGPSAWGEERARVLASSKLILNLQQYTLPIVAPLRFALASAYSLPLVTEKLHDDPFPLTPDDAVQAEYSSITNAVEETLRHKDLELLGANIHERFCIEWTFRRGVEEGVREFLRR